VEFVGGLMTAVIALVYLIHTSVTMTGVAFGILLVFGYGINKAFATIRPIFRARAENQRGSHGTPHGIAQRRSRRKGLSRRGARRRSLRPRRTALTGQCSENAHGHIL